MPAKRLGLMCFFVIALVAVWFVLPPGVKAQEGAVALKARVSETVALSVLPNSTRANVETEVLSTGNTVRITISGDVNEAPVIRLPLLVRSNSNYKITAAVEPKTTALTELSVIDVRATGRLVSPQAITELNVPREFELPGLNESSSAAPNLPGVVRPLLVASGPRVSLGGTLASANNALEITLLIGLNRQTTHGWSIHLTFVAAPE